jgi:hypothetical protein
MYVLGEYDFFTHGNHIHFYEKFGYSIESDPLLVSSAQKVAFTFPPEKQTFALHQLLEKP